MLWKFSRMNMMCKGMSQIASLCNKKGCLHFGLEKDLILNYSMMYYFFLSLFWKLY